MTPGYGSPILTAMGERSKNNGTVLPFYTIRLRDLVRPVAVLTVVCEACQHKARADPFAMAASAGPDANLRRLAPLLRCAHCGMKGWVRFEIEWMP